MWQYHKVLPILDLTSSMKTDYSTPYSEIYRLHVLLILNLAFLFKYCLSHLACPTIITQPFQVIQALTQSYLASPN